MALVAVVVLVVLVRRRQHHKGSATLRMGNTAQNGVTNSAYGVALNNMRPLDGGETYVLKRFCDDYDMT